MTAGPPRRDRVLGLVLPAAGIASAGMVALVVVFVVREAWPALVGGEALRFLTDDAWHPTAGRFNVWPMVAGTLAVTAGSLLVTAPIGVGSAAFACFYAPRPLALAYRRAVEVLAGVPSVVYGLWGLTTVVPLVAALSPQGRGQSLLAGIAVLSMMTLPIVAMTADAALRAVPAGPLHAAAALGLSRRAVAFRVAVPMAGRGILTGMVLQTARALGETMAVLMVCGNVARWPGSVFDPVRTLTATIALEMGYAADAHREALFVCGLVLLLVVGLLVGVAEWIDRRHVAVG